MPDRAFMISSFLRPILVPIMGAIWVGALWLLWKKFPEGKLKRLLLFNLWGGKDDPWVKAYRKKPDETVEAQVIHPVQSGNRPPRVDPVWTPPPLPPELPRPPSEQEHH